jgi:methylmalonyl-CoA carboxyltransferase small subunit
LRYKVVVEGKAYDVEVEEADEVEQSAVASAALASLQSAILPDANADTVSDVDESKVCRSPLAGVVARIQANPGDRVQKDQVLLVLEAMKMEIKIAAPSDGTLKSIEVALAAAVKPRQVLLCFE